MAGVWQALARLGLMLAWLAGAVGGAAAADGAASPRLAALFGGPWSLTAADDGRAVTEASWRDRVVILYFGYLFCPDLCPTQLQVIAEAMDLLGPDADRVQPLFVSVDPERDSAERIALFTAQFHPRILGLTGTPEQIARIARAYRVSFEKVGSGPNYAIDHSVVVYLIDPDGGTAAVLGPDTSADALAAAVRSRLRSQHR
ncbi:MAG: SCO family protein [Rhodospirillaceae bacterium]